MYEDSFGSFVTTAIQELAPDDPYGPSLSDYITSLEPTDSFRAGIASVLSDAYIATRPLGWSLSTAILTEAYPGFGDGSVL